jgi:hypothetical protein
MGMRLDATPEGVHRTSQAITPEPCVSLPLVGSEESSTPSGAPLRESWPALLSHLAIRAMERGGWPRYHHLMHWANILVDKDDIAPIAGLGVLCGECWNGGKPYSLQVLVDNIRVVHMSNV